MSHPYQTLIKYRLCFFRCIFFLELNCSFTSDRDCSIDLNCFQYWDYFFNSDLKIDSVTGLQGILLMIIILMVLIENFFKENIVLALISGWSWLHQLWRPSADCCDMGCVSREGNHPANCCRSYILQILEGECLLEMDYAISTIEKMKAKWEFEGFGCEKIC